VLGVGTGTAVKVALEFMKTETEIDACSAFHAGGGLAPVAGAGAVSDTAGASEMLVTMVDRDNFSRAAVNCWIWK
jgi:hypothetical protein